MPLAPESFSSRRDTLAFIVCLVLSLAIRIAPPSVQRGLMAGVTETVLAPLLFLEHQSELLKAARGRYASISATRDSVTVLGLEAAALRDENARLRALLRLSDRLSTRHVAAEVLVQSTPASSQSVLLSAGSADGVEPRSPIVAPAGLVGVVGEVSAHVSVGILWTHPDFRASAMTEDGTIYGIVAPYGATGPGTTLLELEGVPFRDLIPPGTRIVTSGLAGRAGVFPRGIPIGTIMGVAEEQEGWSRTYIVRPAVHPASASHVIVLLGPTTDVSSAFAEPGT